MANSSVSYLANLRLNDTNLNFKIPISNRRNKLTMPSAVVLSASMGRIQTRPPRAMNKFRAYNTFRGLKKEAWQQRTNWFIQSMTVCGISQLVLGCNLIVKRSWREETRNSLSRHVSKHSFICLKGFLSWREKIHVSSLENSRRDEVSHAKLTSALSRLEVFSRDVTMSSLESSYLVTLLLFRFRSAHQPAKPIVNMHWKLEHTRRVASILYYSGVHQVYLPGSNPDWVGFFPLCIGVHS